MVLVFVFVTESFYSDKMIQSAWLKGTKSYVCLLCLQLTCPHPFIHGAVTACILYLNFKLVTSSFKI